jgi:hypothetical protein
LPWSSTAFQQRNEAEVVHSQNIHIKERSLSKVQLSSNIDLKAEKRLNLRIKDQVLHKDVSQRSSQTCSQPSNGKLKLIDKDFKRDKKQSLTANLLTNLNSSLSMSQTTECNPKYFISRTTLESSTRRVTILIGSQRSTTILRSRFLNKRRRPEARVQR